MASNQEDDIEANQRKTHVYQDLSVFIVAQIPGISTKHTEMIKLCLMLKLAYFETVYVTMKAARHTRDSVRPM